MGITKGTANTLDLLSNTLRSNEPINTLKNGIRQMIDHHTMTKSGYMSKNNITRSKGELKNKDGKWGDMDRAKAFFHNKDGSVNKTAIAGSYLGVAGAYRAATGGGWAVDGQGRHDIVGVPFV